MVGRARILAKPFKPAALLMAVRELLDDNGIADASDPA